MLWKDPTAKIKDSIRSELGNSVDVEYQEMKSFEKEAALIYIKSVCDANKINRYLLAPFFNAQTKEDFEGYLSSYPGCKKTKDEKDAIHSIIHGAVAVFVQNKLFLFDAALSQTSPVSEATIETSVQGPRDALTESLDINLNLIRTRYHTASLRVEPCFIGEKNRMKMVLIFDDQLADMGVLNEMKQSLSQIKVDMIQSVGQLEKIFGTAKWRWFPTLMITERPDRIVKNLSDGKVVILLDKSPFSIIAPTSFYDFFTAMDDEYQLPFIARFLMILRYIGLFFTIVLPGMYVAMTAYNPEIFRVQLILSIAGSRSGVPYPAFLEVLFLLLMMEMLVESSIRLPKTIGPTATTVGGLILGQAASQAGLVSNIMIILVASVAISNFVIPINAMSFSMRIVKYPMLALGTLFGLMGMTLGIIGLVFYLANQRSFGKPYFKLFIKRE